MALPTNGFKRKYTLQGEEVVYAAMDLTGVAVPTGVCDGAYVALQAKNNERDNATLCLCGTIPYFGYLAKVGKIGKDIIVVKNAIHGLTKGMEINMQTKLGDVELERIRPN